MKNTRIYLEKIYYAKKQGGGSFYKWIDMDADGNQINIHILHSMEKGKKLPTSGSGSGASYTVQEAKALIRLFRKGIKLIENEK